MVAENPAAEISRSDARREDALQSAVEAAKIAPPKRILIYGINYTPEPIGVGRFTGELGAFLVQHGTRVAVVTAVPHYPGWLLRDGYRNRYLRETISGASVIRCPLFLTAEMRGIWRMIAPLSFAVLSAPVAIWRILRFRPDTVLCVEPTLFSAPAALLAAKLIGARTVLHIQDLEIDAAFAMGHLNGGLLQRAARMFERITLKAFDAVVTISRRMRDKLKEKGIPEDRLSVVRNWVDLKKIRPLDGANPFRQALQLGHDDFAVLYAGNIGAKQGLEIVLDAAAALQAEPNLVFVIAGDGPEKARLQKVYCHLKNVRFLPTQPEDKLCELLNLADLHILPQSRDAADLVLPSKLGGMLASGRPVLVMADPGTELYSFVEGTADIVPTGDTKAVCDFILNVSRLENRQPSLRGRVLAEQLETNKILPEFASILGAPNYAHA